MKINKILTIGNNEVYNNSNVFINFDHNNLPYLSFFKKDTIEKVALPIKIEKTIEIIKSEPFNNGVSLGSYTLIQNDANEIVDIVKYNSKEYKRYFSKTTIKASSIEQGAVVKLNNDSTLIFLKQIYGLYYYRFVHILGYIKDKRALNDYYISELNINITRFKFFENEPCLYNVFYSLEENKIVYYLANSTSTKIIDVLGSVPEFKNKDFYFLLKENEEAFLEDVTNLKEFVFQSETLSIKYNKIKNSIIFIKSKKEMLDFKDKILNYINN